MRLLATVLGALAISVPAVAIGSVATGLLRPAAAQADADPASDVLLIQNVFFPYRPVVSPALQKTLSTETAAASRGHFPVKVALVASPIDLGAIPQLFGRPQRYADFLEQEISFGGPQPLLVVMPAGYGLDGMGPAARALEPGLHKPAGAGGLAQAAITALPRLAAAAGHPIPRAAAGPASTSSRSGGSSTIIIVVVALAAVAISSAVVAARNRPGRR